ncbi:glycoside hydrolase family 5 protein [Asticcacaulis sp. EMRT-3]|uniref:glycoside hydrolase family 5 protein n=1 Tax=Asticcacaulis sp. EMRT-3 TaxID=3040349 RepID=UPI0024AF1C01|nr:glycoside hydrolase family 5 protein [Asticcacaulis sp. EMRT-3]MDI7774084.1 glycoside hydrolase family 5 protein [Asticcacaulis sp. EMRT-3]
MKPHRPLHALMPARLVSIGLASLMLAAAAPALAQGGYATNGATADTEHVTAGRETDLVQNQIKSYNSFTNDSSPAAPTVYANPGEKFVAISPEDQVKLMGAGINIIPGWDPYWDGKPTTFKDSDIKNVAEAGFKTIRVPIMPFTHIIDTQGNLDPAYLKRIDHIIDLAIANHLNIIIDEHNYNECAKDADGCGILLSNVWYDLALRYQTAPNSVMFELLNEPNGQIDAKIWNAWLPDLVASVRQFDPTRNIIIGPVMWNSADQLVNLKLPADAHTIVTFHYYTPMEFTHQGASWVKEDEGLRNVRWTGTPEQMSALNTTFDAVKAWSTANNHPIFLGEYGSYGKFNHNMADRAAWTRAVSAAADQRGFARAYWLYEDDGGFGVYDTSKDQWVKPILKALLPDSPAAQ